MRDPGYELRRIPLPRTSVNKPLERINARPKKAHLNIQHTTKNTYFTTIGQDLDGVRNLRRRWKIRLGIYPDSSFGIHRSLLLYPP
jgi:hypothetical protein